MAGFGGTPDAMPGDHPAGGIVEEIQRQANLADGILRPMLAAIAGEQNQRVVSAIAIGRIATDDAARLRGKSNAGDGERAIEIPILILERPVGFGMDLSGNRERTRGKQQKNRGYSPNA